MRAKEVELMNKTQENSNKKYYIYYPSNFANEYIIYSVANEKENNEIKAFQEKVNNTGNSDCHQISRKDALKMISKKYLAERGGQSFVSGIEEWGDD